MNISRALATALLMGFCESPGATGADGKTFPGEFCHPDGQTLTVFHSSGGLFNAIGLDTILDPSDDFSQYFGCPVVRDVMAAQGDGILFARMNVNDSSSSEDVSCTLYSRYQTGPTSAPIVKEFVTRTSSGTGTQRLSYPGLDSESRGTYDFLCHIPKLTSSGFSGIWSYDVEEKSP